MTPFVVVVVGRVGSSKSRGKKKSEARCALRLYYSSSIEDFSGRQTPGQFRVKTNEAKERAKKKKKKINK